MVLEFLGERHDKESIKSLVESDSTGNTWSIGLAKAAGELGFKTEFYSKKLGFNAEHFSLDYYQKLTDGAAATQLKSEHLHKRCKELGVTTIEGTFTLAELLSRISIDCTAIGLFDWNRIDGCEGYKGHFMPIVGYEDGAVLVHQPGPSDPTPYLPLPQEVFELARKAPGTDEDLIFIHRKGK
jgi:hypothetical protein